MSINNPYAVLQDSLCKVTLGGLSPTVFQNRLSNLGTLRMLLSMSNRGGLEYEVLRNEAQMPKAYRLRYTPASCTPTSSDCSLSACNPPSGSVQGTKWVELRKNAKCISSGAIKFTKQDVESYCSVGNTSTIEGFSQLLAARIKESLTGMYAELDRQLLNGLYDHAQFSATPNISSGGLAVQSYNINPLTPIAGGGYVYNDFSEAFVRTAFEKNGIPYSDIQYLGGTAATFIEVARKKTLPVNQLQGVNVDLEESKAARTFVDYNLDTYSGSASTLLGVLPGVFHFLTYSDLLGGYSAAQMYNQLSSSFAQLSANGNTEAAKSAIIADMIKGKWFSGIQTDEASQTYFLDNSLGVPMVVELHITKERCGGVTLFAKINYELVALPLDDFVCGMPGFKGIINYNVCLPSQTVNCANTPILPTPSRLCVTPINPADCHVFVPNTPVTIDINGGAGGSFNTTNAVSIVANNDTNATLLLGNILSSVSVATISGNGVITQSTSAVPQLSAGDTITITSNCGQALNFTVGDCDPSLLAKVTPKSDGANTAVVISDTKGKINERSGKGESK